MAFQELLRVRSVKHVEQKAFDGGVSHRGFPGCVDCSFGSAMHVPMGQKCLIHHTVSYRTGQSPAGVLLAACELARLVLAGRQGVDVVHEVVHAYSICNDFAF